jgi:hypothetical protein
MKPVAETEFGRALRRFRDRTSPDAVGRSTGRSRRAPGLRREELAVLAGISVDYLARLEQGRGGHPSPQIVGALSRALRLDSGDDEHLMLLAGIARPAGALVPSYLPSGVARMVERLDAPVGVIDAADRLLGANALFSALFGDPLAPDDSARSAAWRHFLGPGTPVRYTDEQRAAHENALVGRLREASERFPADDSVARLIAELRAGSPRFASLWAAGASGRYGSGHKTIDHPMVGELELDCDVLEVSETGLIITVYTAEPGSESAQRLELLGVIGTQQFSA